MKAITTQALTEADRERLDEMMARYVESGYKHADAERMALKQLFGVDSNDDD